ncbi:MAG: 4'-phosphopantetheinyl transferase superfamily protein [Solirubrobacterales bacterium]
MAVAIGACGPVGVDVEPRAAALDAAALAAALTPAERRALGDLPRARRPATLLRQRVRKEAVLKAAGVGLAVDPAVLDVTVAGRRPCVLACPALPGVVGCAVCDLRGPAGAVAALASLAHGVDAVEVDGDALLGRLRVVGVGQAVGARRGPEGHRPAAARRPAATASAPPVALTRIT